MLEPFANVALAAHLVDEVSDWAKAFEGNDSVGFQKSGHAAKTDG